MSETRGRLVGQLQEVYKQKKTLEEEHKEDTAAWNELMNVTIMNIQRELMRALEESVAKVKTLEQQNAALLLKQQQQQQQQQQHHLLLPPPPPQQ